jgi:hypothetical protein
MNRYRGTQAEFQFSIVALHTAHSWHRTSKDRRGVGLFRCDFANTRFIYRGRSRSVPRFRRVSINELAVFVTLQSDTLRRAYVKCCDARQPSHQHSRHRDRWRSYRHDYTVIWHGLPIGRIRKNPGLPAHTDQWSWGCNVYGQPSLSSDSGTGTDLEDCKAKFMIAWARIRAGLRDRDIAAARQYAKAGVAGNDRERYRPILRGSGRKSRQEIDTAAALKR